MLPMPYNRETASQETESPRLRSPLNTARHWLKLSLLILTGGTPLFAQGCCPLNYAFCFTFGWQGCADYSSNSSFAYYGTAPHRKLRILSFGMCLLHRSVQYVH